MTLRGHAVMARLFNVRLVQVDGREASVPQVNACGEPRAARASRSFRRRSGSIGGAVANGIDPSSDSPAIEHTIPPHLAETYGRRALRAPRGWRSMRAARKSRRGADAFVSRHGRTVLDEPAPSAPASRVAEGRTAPAPLPQVLLDMEFTRWHDVGPTCRAETRSAGTKRKGGHR